MKFRTAIELPPFGSKIGYESRILTIGSCFASEMGSRMERAKLMVNVNPLGVLFNPISIAQTLERIASKRFVSKEELTEREGIFSHYDFHGSLSANSAEECVKKINSAIEATHQNLMESDWVIITLGTAWVYELKDGGHIVGNCHKMPHATFSRRRLEVEEITTAINTLISESLSEKNIIITLSPIRHIADGLAENSLSKATLRVAIDQIIKSQPNCHYFPSYEILMDDLRDYRFYGEDMVHPTSQAVEYIWELFRDSALSPKAKERLKRVEKIVQAAEHRPINSSSEGYREMCERQIKLIDELPEVEFGKERAYFLSQSGISDEI
ncbi:MAG: GSCFA domain-containing protein [Rikenellaceae bacterium]